MSYLPSVADAFWIGCIRRLRTTHSMNAASKQAGWISLLVLCEQPGRRTAEGQTACSGATQALNLIAFRHSSSLDHSSFNRIRSVVTVATQTIAYDLKLRLLLFEY